LTAAATSKALSSWTTMSEYEESSGRGLPGGGISCVRSLRATFSHDSAPSATCSRSSLSSNSPAVFSRSLWHVTQYLLRMARVDARVVAALDGTGCADGVCATAGCWLGVSAAYTYRDHAPTASIIAENRRAGEIVDTLVT